MLAGGRHDLNVGNTIGIGGSRRDWAVRCLLSARTVGRRLIFAHIGSSACRGPRVVVDDDALFIDNLHAKIVGHQARCRDRTQLPRGPIAVFLVRRRKLFGCGIGDFDNIGARVIRKNRAPHNGDNAHQHQYRHERCQGKSQGHARGIAHRWP